MALTAHNPYPYTWPGAGRFRVQPPTTEAALASRVVTARAWGRYYGTLGWRIAPSCGGEHDGRTCPVPDRHPQPDAGHLPWRQEASTSPRALDELWERRPRAYGVIAATGTAAGPDSVDLHAAEITGLSWNRVLERLEETALNVPVLRLVGIAGSDCERLIALTRSTFLDKLADRFADGSPMVRRVIPFLDHRPLPLPAAAEGGHAMWLRPPARQRRLADACELLGALGPLYGAEAAR